MQPLQYYGHPYAEYIICQKAILTTNRETISHILKMAIVMMSFFVAASFILPFLEIYRMIYFATAVSLAALALAYERLLFLKRNSTLGAYLLMTILYGFGIIMAIPQHDQTSSIFNLLLVILPIFFIDKFLRMALYTLLAGLLFCVISYKTKLPEVASRAVFSCLCHYVISLMAHFYVNYRIVGGMISDRKRDDALVSYQKAQYELRAQVQKDPLTGLYNRAAFIELAVLQLEKCWELGRYPALGILDLDHFKSINDTYGHQAGDEVLVGVAAILQKTLRGSDIVGRLGGDEYIFLLTDIAGDGALPAILERLLEGVTQMGRDRSMPLHASVGLILSIDMQDTFDSLYHRADIALYTAKNTGRNRYVIYR